MSTTYKTGLPLCIATAVAVLIPSRASALIQTPPSITSFYNSANGSFHVLAVPGGGGGSVEFYLTPGNNWNDNGAMSLTTLNGLPLASNFDGTTQHLFALSIEPMGDVWEGEFASHQETQQSLTNGQNLDYVQLTGNEDIAVNGGLYPLWDGSIEHVFYSGKDAHIHELYKDDGTWFPNDLTIASGDVSEPLGSGVAAFWTGDTEYVFWKGVSNHLRMSSCGPGGCWTLVTDLTDSVTGTQTLVRTCCSAIGYEGGGHVFFEDTNGHVQELLLFQGAFSALDATVNAGSVPSLTASTAFIDGGGIMHIYFVGSDSHLHELWGLGGPDQETPGGWNSTDVTAATGDKNPYYDSATGGGYLMRVTGFTEPNHNHVFYFGVDNDIHEAYHPIIGGTWGKNDLDVATSFFPIYGWGAN